jgi:hypothetical protein
MLSRIEANIPQQGKMSEAEDFGRKAIELAKGEGDPWAVHALAHVYYNTLKFKDGIDLLKREKDNWDGCNSFMYTHNWWHYTLVECDSGQLIFSSSY